MSRIGKKPLTIPEGVSVAYENGMFCIRGPKGELKQTLPDFLDVSIKEKEITVLPKEQQFSKERKAMWGSSRAKIAQALKGVTEGYEKRLEFEGIGYRAEVQGNTLVLHIGFTHPVKIEAPSGISFSVEKNSIKVNGIDADKVGQLTAKIRATRPPEPYKGTGIKYVGEHIRRKAGKKVVAAAK